MRIIVIGSNYDSNRVAAFLVNDDPGLAAGLQKLEKICEDRDLRIEYWRPDDMSVAEAIKFIEEEYPSA